MATCQEVILYSSKSSLNCCQKDNSWVGLLGHIASWLCAHKVTNYKPRICYLLPSFWVLIFILGDRETWGNRPAPTLLLYPGYRRYSSPWCPLLMVWQQHSIYSQKHSVSPWRESQNHRRVCLQRTLKGHIVQFPEMRNQEVPLGDVIWYCCVPRITFLSSYHVLCLHSFLSALYHWHFFCIHPLFEQNKMFSSE